MAKLVVIGSGIVGQATGKGLIAKGHQMVFSDLNPEVLAKLRKEGHTVCPPESLGQETNIEAFFLAVSTPTVDGRIQLGFLESAVANLGTVLRNHGHYSIVVVRSTVPPGTTREMLVPLLEKYSEKKAGQDFGVCMNPEYLREHRNEEDFKHPWLVTIGELDAKSGQALENIYGACGGCPIYHVSLEEAEIQKYVHNLWNAAKISFFNEMRDVCEKTSRVIGARVNTDKIFQVTMKSAEASWNPEYGIRDFGPFGGTCLPKDTAAFLAWAKDKLGKTPVLLKAVIAVNDNLIRNQ